MTQADRATHPTLEVLYFEGCPNHERAVALVRRALADEHIALPIRMIRVDTEEEARHYGFYGSPSIRVNGEDVAPVTKGATPGLACRVYQMANGRLAPVPAYEAVVSALRRNMESTA